MKAKEIQELISFLAESGLEEVNIETEGFKVQIKRSSEQTAIAAPIQPVTVAPQPAVTSPVALSAPPQQTTKEEVAQKDDLLEIKSPMIGTFYRSPNPDEPAFVEVGSVIKSGDIVCIVEAMKLFNEIESEVSGKIVKALVDDAQPVEYDQPLFLVDPS